MPSPFPGMDPYLENPITWPNLHLLLIAATNSQLKPLLRPRGYLVTIGERVWVSDPGRPVYPDVAVIEQHSPPRANSGNATTIEADEPVLIKVFEAEIHEPYIEIIDAAGGKLVTGIEFLSPANKSPGTGREKYRQKQRETLRSGANLVEIDLLRGGRHTLAVPVHLLDTVPEWHYLVSVSRVSHPDQYETYPIPIQSRLPRLRVPLAPGDDDVVLDLQRVLDQAYSEGPFEDRIDYRMAPNGRLSAEAAAWLDRLLQDQGMRPSGSAPG